MHILALVNILIFQRIYLIIAFKLINSIKKCLVMFVTSPYRSHVKVFYLNSHLGPSQV